MEWRDRFNKNFQSRYIVTLDSRVWLKGRLQRQVAGRVANINRLGIVGHDPVLGDRVPVRDVAPRQGGRPQVLLTRRKGDTVEATKNLGSVIGTAKRDVLEFKSVKGTSSNQCWVTYQLRNLVTRNLTGVGDDGGDPGNRLIQTRVATRSTASRVNGLRVAVRGVGRNVLLRRQPIVRVIGGRLQIGGVEPWVDVQRDPLDVAGVQVVRSIGRLAE